jgi:hypothetical protein
VSGGHDDYAVEPIRGLPERPPAGEQIIWQGSPSWWAMAKHVFHIRAVAAYLLALIAWRAGVHLQDGQTPAAIVAALSLLPVSLGALGLLALLAWLCSHTSVYTITSKRIVMRVGVALPTAINLPFTVIGAAGLRGQGDGPGDICLSLIGEERMAYSNLWPHVRPWHLSRPQPTLRGIPHARQVAEILGQALAQALPQTGVLAPAQGGARSPIPSAVANAPVFARGQVA